MVGRSVRNVMRIVFVRQRRARWCGRCKKYNSHLDAANLWKKSTRATCVNSRCPNVVITTGHLTARAIKRIFRGKGAEHG